MAVLWKREIEVTMDSHPLICVEIQSVIGMCEELKELEQINVAAIEQSGVISGATSE
jgi:hypothetical protein